MFGFADTGESALVWTITPDGGMALERGTDDGRGTIHLSGGGTITRQRIVQRGERGKALLSFFAALVTDLPPEIERAAAQFVGFCVPAWFEAEMREALARKVRDGRLILGGKRQPLSAESPWHRFDATALGAWDFRLDNTARPLIGEGDTYAQVTAFTPAQWQRAHAVKGGAPRPAPAVPHHPTPGGESRSRGGRPPHHARQTFRKAMTARANHPDGLGDLAECTRAMTQWAEAKFGDDAPSESAIRAWVREDWPED
jgi:hypothetical protein